MALAGGVGAEVMSCRKRSGREKPHCLTSEVCWVILQVSVLESVVLRWLTCISRRLSWIVERQQGRPAALLLSQVREGWLRLWDSFLFQEPEMRCWNAQLALEDGCKEKCRVVILAYSAAREGTGGWGSEKAVLLGAAMKSLSEVLAGS